MVVARWTPATVEYLVLSDSALLLESPDGVVTPVLDDRLALLPRSALADATRWWTPRSATRRAASSRRPPTPRWPGGR